MENGTTKVGAVGGDRIEPAIAGACQRPDAQSTVAGDQAFALIGTNAFSKIAGQLRMEQSGGNTYVYGDADGNGVADFAIRLDGALPLTTADFIL